MVIVSSGNIRRYHKTDILAETGDGMRWDGMGRQRVARELAAFGTEIQEP